VPFNPRSLVRRVLPNPFRSTWFPRFRLPSWVDRAESPRPERKERLSHPYGGDVTLRTSGSVSIHEHARVRAGWPKPYPLGATPLLTSDAFPPPRLGGGPVPSRQIALSARVSVGAFPSAIEWCALPAPATYSIRFSKTTAHASPHSGPRFPTGPGDSRFYVGISTSADPPAVPLSLRQRVCSTRSTPGDRASALPSPTP